ncbi:MAG: DUF4446 family protein [Candidatus Pacebacteria bacterium]|nr:DUF4446 family protein [Candidatus Paceibacterota bacterium]
MFKLFNKNNKEPKNLADVVKQIKKLEAQNKSLLNQLEELKKQNAFCIQKTEVIRFNPFSGTGGDQSFSIALLDASNNGLVITSIFGHEGNRVYAKPIKQGGSSYTLSEEEKEVIRKAVGK